MPLTQDRYLTLLTACDHYEAALDSYLQLIPMLDAQIASGELTPAAAYAALTNTIVETKIPKEVERDVSAERAHFLATSRRNDTAREYKRRIRAGKSTIGTVERVKGFPVYRQNTARPNIASNTSSDMSKPLDGDGSGIDYAKFRDPCLRFCRDYEIGKCLQPDQQHYICRNGTAKNPLKKIEEIEPEAIDTIGDML